MNKIIILLFSVFFLVSCEQKKGVTTELDKSTPIEKLLVSYHKSHPDWLINDVVARKTNDSLMVLFESMADTIFNGYPMKAITVNEYSKGGFCVSLQAWQTPYNFELKDEINEIGGDVIALVSEEQALKIKEDEFYTFKGHFVKRTNHDFFQKMTGLSMHYTDNYGVEKDDTFNDKYSFGFGMLVYTVDTLIHY
ncbi:MAG: hypothetical protein K5893_04265 [Prevotella sp.]|nr:hypothetical protein [Prevotella sp.]